MTKITSAVFPVAGLGTRFLPATKASPKEMLPVLDKPLIQYAVEEAIAAGITQIIFVTSSTKRAIEDHFDVNFELETRLAEAGKKSALETVRACSPQGVHFVYIRQPQPRGLGDAVWHAKEIVGDQDFAVLLADEILWSAQQTCLQGMIDHHEKTNHCVLAVEEVPDHEVSRYGIVGLESDKSVAVKSIIEKPSPAAAPSNLAVIGRYILSSKIFDHLEKTPVGHGGELQLTDAIAAMLKESPVDIYRFKGQRYDCGNPMGCIQASIELGLQSEKYGAELSEYLKNLKTNN